MQYVILGLLLTGPLSLYDVRKRFAAGISLFYGAGFGSIQRALRQLVDAGAVTVTEASDSRRGKKLYALTDDGRRRWRAWMLEPIPVGQEAETLILAKVFLLGRLAEQDDRAAVLAAARECAASSLAGLRDLDAGLDGAAVPEEHRTAFGYQRATLVYGLRAHDLLATWLAELSEQPR